MSLKASISLRLKFRDAHTAEAVRVAVLPEMLGFRPSRGGVSLELDRDSLLLEIRADGISSLRVLLNSYLRWVICAEEVTEILYGHDDSPSNEYAIGGA
jgi:tRNA threonylcarbamoyladenosine modification (KEOPS) complex  Pcc1 subunit